ncbi:unnamed protein product [Rotaria sp. Silwood1]|nr:unnamed protein product [Rotaria sp. Silwood1]
MYTKYRLSERQTLGIDLVHDNVEQELIREVKTIELSQQKLRQMLKRLNRHNALNLVSLHELERDAEDKFHAHVLDSAALNIKTTSWDINFYESIENVDNTVSVPESWARYTQENIRRSLNQIGQSDELLNASNQLVATIYNDIWSQWNHVNISLENRLQEEQLAKNKIQAHLEKTYVFAQTRLETRSRRPNVEACRDSAMHRLIQEVDDLHAAIDELHSKLCQEENAVQLLLRTKSILEQDLIIKNNSLFIDSEKVMGIRRKFMMSASEKSFVTSIPYSQPHDLITV